ncbi:YceI family protein [Tenacibaculum holothuriorum]|nr:YceI family protein [Tenacibaculum holothuriorum]
MNTIKKGIFVIGIIATGALLSGYITRTSTSFKKEVKEEMVSKTNKMINMFVTHGHCSTPFAGVVDNLDVNIPVRSDMGNPLEDISISFEVDPNSFKACRGDKVELTSRIKTPGVFIGNNDEKIIFKSTNVYTMGIDWYQINGKMTVKGIEREVKFFATGIRNTYDVMTNSLVLQGQVNLFDWGIDYDKLVNGRSEEISTKWLYLNMKIDLC